MKRLRRDLGFRRIAIVLSGGGALGAYEVGTLKVLEALAVVPSLVAGVSIGAINAAVWVAHGRRAAALEAAWHRMRASTIGLRWVTLALRWMGAGLFVIGVTEIVITLAGSRELSGSYWLWRKNSARLDVASTILDATAWLVAAALGIMTLVLSRPLEDWLARAGPPTDPSRLHRRAGAVLLAMFLVHTAVWVFGWPWPHRFSASALLVTLVFWLANRPGRGGHWLRTTLFALMPETGGRGLWGSRARRRVIEDLVKRGRPERLVNGETRLVVSALAIDSGRVCHFVNWSDASGTFETRVNRELGEVVALRTPEDVITATVASSAIPGVFEPVPVGGRNFVDAGGFSNQPLHIAIADDADAVLTVLLSPSDRPSLAPGDESLFQLGGRLLELANWRDLQTELRHLPEGWSRTGDPARVCVVEPDLPLPGGVLSFDPETAPELIARGEHDTWRALERAGWLEEDPGPS